MKKRILTFLAGLLASALFAVPADAANAPLPNIYYASWAGTTEAGLLAADATCASKGWECILDASYTLTADRSLSAKWVGAGGIITRGSHALSGNFSAPDTVQMFNPADTGTLTPNSGNILTPENMGYTGTNTTTDTLAINKLQSLNVIQHLLGHAYNINGPIFATFWNDRVDNGAQFVQTGTNMPVLSVFGDMVGKDTKFPTLCFTSCSGNNSRPTTELNSVGLVLSGHPINGNGFYQAAYPYAHIRSATVGVYNPGTLTTNVSAAFASCSTTLTIANAQTNLAGAFPIVPGIYFTLTADDGTTTSQELVTNVSGSTVTVSPCTPFAGSGTATNKFVSVASTLFSGTLQFNVRDASYSCGAFMGPRTITDFHMLRCFNSFTTPESPFTPAAMAWYPWYFSNGLNDHWSGGINVEHMQLSTDAIEIDQNSSTPGPAGFSIDGAHFESINFLTGGKCLFGGRNGGGSIGPVVVHQIAALTTNVSTNPISAYCFQAPTGSRGYFISNIHFDLGVPRFGGNIFDGTHTFYILRDLTNSGKVVYSFHGVPILDYGAGITLRTNLQDDFGLVDKMGAYFPSNMVGFGLDLTLSSTSTILPVYLLPGSNKVDAMLAVHSRPATGSGLTTGTGGVYSDNLATTLISNAANTAMSPILDSTNWLDFGVGGISANKSISAGVVYFKAANTQGNGSNSGAVSTTDSYSGGLLGSVALINFATPHGWAAGTAFLGNVASCTNSLLNASQVWITAVSTTALEYYILTDGTTAAIPLGADTTCTVNQTPTFSLNILGEHWPALGVN